MFYVTYASKDEAQSMVDKLLAKRLIACGNISPIESNYIWEDKLNSADEYTSILKTSYSNAAEVEAFIIAHHSYEVPCIARWEVQCNEAYEDWVMSSVTPIDKK